MPGNHDLNWKLSKKQGYKLIDREDYAEELKEGHFIEVGADVVRIRDQEGYNARFAHFSTFYGDIKNPPYPTDSQQQGVLHHFPEMNLLVLGLNSVWQADHHFKSRASIHDGSLAAVLNEIRDNETYEDCLKFAVWHHPLDSQDPDRITDHGFMERLAQSGFSVVLHGHLHKASASQYRYDMSAGGRKIDIIGAGTFGALTRDWQPGYPLQYNLLKLEGEKLIVETRCRREINGTWKPDAIWTQGPGKDPLPRYEITLPASCGMRSVQVPEDIPERPGYVDSKPLALPDAYKKWLVDRCRHMDIDRLRERGKVIQVNLPEMFIPLYCRTLKEKKVAGSSLSATVLLREKEQFVDLESLIRETPYLLIKGQAGSGKTTLIRHFCLTVVDQENSGVSRLPLLIFLKDMKGLDIEEYPNAGAESAEKMLAFYFEQTQNGLDLETTRRYCRAGKVFFLFDGLDEIDRQRRDLIADSFADLGRRHEGCQMIFSGRPHGFEGAVIDRFGDRHVEILPLTMNQVELFVNKWFCTIMEGNTASCQTTAAGMIAEMKAHPAVDALKDTPLMLTAICLLYLDGKELPEQRAELYKKFMEFLVYRRFDFPEKILKYLKKLALEMHRANTRVMDRRPAVALLEEIYPKQEDESKPDYYARLEQGFDRIEPDCGLLKFENGRYEFWHLTFQEFFTASALADRERRDLFQAIKDYWEDEWWQEVVELYVGYLSIQNAGMANEIARRVLKGNDNIPYIRWRLATRALHSIHQDKRELDAVSLASDRLLKIVSSDASPADRLDAGETLGRLGDPRKLKEFIPVPEGLYPLGKKKRKVEAFKIAQYPVTNRWFAEFIQTGGYAKEEFWTDEGRKWLAVANVKAPRYWHDRKWNCPNAPVVGVCWYEAHAFVCWLEATADDGCHYFLPEDNQWQAAASGLDGREYPWEGAWQEDCCNSEECGLKRISPVGIFPKGVTPEGIDDLAGNAWEWTSSDYHSGKSLADFTFDAEIYELDLEYESAEDKEKRERVADKIIAKANDPETELPVLRGGSWFNHRY